MKLAWIF